MGNEMERYEGSNIYPIDNTTIIRIAANMREYGFDRNFPILTKDGGIVDGYHRYKAAKLAGVEPVVEEFDGSQDDALAFVLRANGDRRQLNEGQKAAAAVRINRMLGKEIKTIKELAKSFGLTESTVNRLLSYSDEELAAIVSGAKTQAAVQESKKKTTPGQSTTYTLTKSQAARVASLAVQLDERGKKLLARAFDAGIKVLEEAAAA